MANLFETIQGKIDAMSLVQRYVLGFIVTGALIGMTMIAAQSS